MGILWFEEGEGRDVFELVGSGQIKELVFVSCNGSSKVFPRRVI